MNPWSYMQDMLAEYATENRQRHTEERMLRNNPVSVAPPAPVGPWGKPMPSWRPPGFKSTRGQDIPEMQEYLREQVPQLQGDHLHWSDPAASQLKFLGDDFIPADQAPKVVGSNPKLTTEPVLPPSAHAMYGKTYPAPTPWTPEAGGGPWLTPLKVPADAPGDRYAGLLENLDKPSAIVGQDLERSSTALNQMYPGWPAEKLMQELGPAAGLSKNQIPRAINPLVDGEANLLPGLAVYSKVPSKYRLSDKYPFTPTDEDRIYMPKSLPNSLWSGVLFHELRHSNAQKNEPWFEPDRRNQTNKSSYNIFNEQPNHLPGPHGDRAVAEMLTAQNIQRKTGQPYPKEILQRYPHLEGKSSARVIPLPPLDPSVRMKYPTFEKRKN